MRRIRDKQTETQGERQKETHYETEVITEKDMKELKPKRRTRRIRDTKFQTLTQRDRDRQMGRKRDSDEVLKQKRR